MVSQGAKINRAIFPLNGKRNYLPLSRRPGRRYEVELQTNSKSIDSYDIVSVRKVILTLLRQAVPCHWPE